MSSGTKTPAGSAAALIEKAELTPRAVAAARADELLAQANARLLETLRESKLREAELMVSNKSLSLTIEELVNQSKRRQEAEAALHAAKEVAEKANRAKSTFLATASHDLRQPLHSMRLLLAALPRREFTGSSDEILSQLDEAVEIMGRLLHSLLDISKLDAGGVEPNLTTFAVNDLLGLLERTSRPLILEKGLDCRFVPSGATIRSDPEILTEILQNFLSNAIRHCRGGRILVGCRRRQGTLRLEVWDDGEGIAEAELDSVFGEFYQVGTPQRDRDRGLGLGLAIVDRLARLLDHPVDVCSIPDKGTVFAVEVPLAERKARPLRRAPESSAATDLKALGDVLVVEDNLKVAQATERLLRAWGLRVKTVSTGLQALRAVKSGGRRPDLVVLDYNLPRGTGATVLKAIRTRLRHPVPGIIITGHLSPLMLNDAQAVECRVLQKPIDPEKLKSLIAELIPAPKLKHHKRRRGVAGYR